MKYNEEIIKKNGERKAIEEAFDVSDSVVMSAVVDTPVVATKGSVVQVHISGYVYMLFPTQVLLGTMV
jgi:hypothetical protein